MTEGISRKIREGDQEARDSLEQHDQASHEVRHSVIRNDDADEKDDAARDEVEEDQDRDELPKCSDRRYEAHRSVDDGSEDERWDHAKRDDVEQNLN